MRPFVIVVVLAFSFYCSWRLVSKTGNPGFLCILFYIPVVNIIALLLITFLEWPVEAELKRYRKLFGDLPEEDQAETDSTCLECGAVIQEGSVSCPMCGWTYKTPTNAGVV